MYMGIGPIGKGFTGFGSHAKDIIEAKSQRREMHKSQLEMSFAIFEKLFDLPDDVKMVHVFQKQESDTIVFRFVSEREAPVGNFYKKDLTEIGYAYRYPERFQEDTSKGYIRGTDRPKE